MAGSLIETLRNTKYTASSSTWVQFIKDHKDYIKSNSERMLIPTGTMNAFKYKPMTFLTTKGISYDKMWIVLFINDIVDPINFTNRLAIYIPRDQLIYDLKIKHNTFAKAVE